MSDDDAKNDVRHRIDQIIAQRELDYKFPTEKANFDRIAKSLDEEGYSPEHIAEGIESFKASLSLFPLQEIGDRKRLRDYLPSFAKIKDKASLHAKGLTLGVIALVAAYPVGTWFERNVWNSSDYAMETLSKYDKKVKFRDPEEVKEIISALDDLLEEFASDAHSDSNAKMLFHRIRNSEYPLSKVASLLHQVGTLNAEFGEVNQFDRSSKYLIGSTFHIAATMECNGMSQEQLGRYVEIAAQSTEGFTHIWGNAVIFYHEDLGVCLDCFPKPEDKK